MNIEDVFDMLVSSDYPIDGSWTVDELTDLILENGIDITQFTSEEIDQLLSMCSDTSPPGDTLIGESSQPSFTGHSHGDMTSGFQDDKGVWHWRDAKGLHDGDVPPDGTESALVSRHPSHSNISFGGYTNADGTYHYTSDNTDRDPETGAIIRRY